MCAASRRKPVGSMCAGPASTASGDAPEDQGGPFLVCADHPRRGAASVAVVLRAPEERPHEAQRARFPAEEPPVRSQIRAKWVQGGRRPGGLFRWEKAARMASTPLRSVSATGLAWNTSGCGRSSSPTIRQAGVWKPVWWWRSSSARTTARAVWLSISAQRCC